MTDTELNDRLLELAGGCRHEWVCAPGIGNEECGLSYRLIGVCKSCDMIWTWRTNPPAVGDGHGMTMEELVLLAQSLWGGGVACVVYRDVASWIGIIAGEGEDPYADGIVGLGSTPALALGAALLAAVDGESK